MTYLTGRARPQVLVANVAELRAVESAPFVDGMEAMIAGRVWRWIAASTLVDDGASILKPTDIVLPAAGRWLATNVAPIMFELDGNYAAAVVPGFFDPPAVLSVYAQLMYVTMHRRTAGSAGSTRCDVLVDGVSIFAAPANQPTIAFGAGDYQTSTKTVFVSGLVNAGSRIECSLEAVEGFLAGPPSGPEGLLVEVGFY